MFANDFIIDKLKQLQSLDPYSQNMKFYETITAVTIVLDFIQASAQILTQSFHHIVSNKLLN